MLPVMPELQSLGKHQYSLVGDVHFANVVALRDQGALFLTTETSEHPFSVDLQQVVYRDSAILALCMAWLREAKRMGLSLSFCYPPASLRSMAKLSGIDILLFGREEAAEWTA